MATQPTDIPEWASEAQAPDILEPPSSKKKEGWTFQEMPVRNWVNWMFKTIYEWIMYFKAENERRIMIRGTSVTLSLRDRLIVVYAMPAYNPSTPGYMGIGYITTDPDPLIHLTQIYAGPDIVEVETNGATINFQFGGTVGSAFEQSIIVVEQLGHPL